MPTAYSRIYRGEFSSLVDFCHLNESCFIFSEDFGAQRIYGCFGAVASGVVVGLWRYREAPTRLCGSVADFVPVILAYIVGSSLNILALSRIRLKSGLEDRWD